MWTLNTGKNRLRLLRAYRTINGSPTSPCAGISRLICRLLIIIPETRPEITSADNMTPRIQNRTLF